MNEKTILREMIERLARDILNKSTMLQGVTRRNKEFTRVFQSAKAIEFHAEGMLKALSLEDQS
jgi:hypothetical protein